MNITPHFTGATVVRVIDEALGWHIERTDKGYALFNQYGYAGTFSSEAEALREDGAAPCNYDRSSTPDGV